MKKLIERPAILQHSKASSRYNQLDELLNALEKRELPADVVEFIDQQIGLLNEVSDSDKHFARLIKNKENGILKHIAKKIQVVPKNYYRKLWLILGISAFGVPIGMALGSGVGNMGLFGAGLPIGMVLGMSLGSNMDKKAFIEGRQLDFEVKY